MDVKNDRRDRSVWAVTVMAGLMLAVAAPTRARSQYAQPDRVRLAQDPVAVREFSLLDQDSRPFTQADLRGRTSLIFFGFTNCRTVCPPTMQTLRSVSRSIADERLLAILVSVDAERDTTAVLKTYLEPFMPGFIGLTGKPAAVRQLADGFSAVFFKGMQTDMQGGYNVEHTSQVYLVDQTGRLRATFYNAQKEDIERLTRSIMRE